MNQTQQQIYVEVWRTAAALIEAVNRMDQRSAQRQVASRSRLDTLLDVYGVGALVPFFYAHLEGGGHYPHRFTLISNHDAFLEIGCCRDMTTPAETTVGYVSLHLRRRGRQSGQGSRSPAPWMAVDLRPAAFDAALERAVCERNLAVGEGDTVVLKLLTGRLYMKPRRQASLDPVETRLTEEMPKTHFNLLEQVSALLLWRDFQHQEGKLDVPAIPAWTAVVQHVVGVLNGHALSSARAAALQGVDPALVCDLRLRLMQTVRLAQYADRYTVFDAPAGPDLHSAVQPAA